VATQNKIQVTKQYQEPRAQPSKPTDKHLKKEKKTETTASHPGYPKRGPWKGKHMVQDGTTPEHPNRLKREHIYTRRQKKALKA
jgi:hypothetical protein